MVSDGQDWLHLIVVQFVERRFSIAHKTVVAQLLQMAGVQDKVLAREGDN